MLSNNKSETRAHIAIKSLNLHIHSSCSDGVYKPKHIIETARQKGIDIISITDHDTVEAYKHIHQTGLAVRILPGIEFSSNWDNQDVHILGYGVDTKNRELNDMLIWMKDGRFSRAEKMIEKLENLGVKIPLELVLSFTGEKNLIVRPHIAQALVAEKYCRTKQEAFDKYIGNDSPAYVPKPKLSTSQVIDLIHTVGGLAVVAHPGKLKHMSYLDEFAKLGLDGVEVYHPDHNAEMVNDLEIFCLKHKLYQTGGSDYHGDSYSGGNIEPCQVPEQVLSDVQSIWDSYKCRIQ
jgi:predicted metal-dependent phosphoesterase TrpH